MSHRIQHAGFQFCAILFCAILDLLQPSRDGRKWQKSNTKCWFESRWPPADAEFSLHHSQHLLKNANIPMIDTSIYKIKRSWLAQSQQVEDAQKLQSVADTASNMREFNIGRRTVTEINVSASATIDKFKEPSQVRWCSLDHFELHNFLTLKPIFFQIDSVARANKCAVTIAVIQQQRESICEETIKTCECDELKNKLQSFFAFLEWLWNFEKRHYLRSVLPNGERGSVSGTQVASKISFLRTPQKDFDKDNIYNEDEIGLCFILLPRRTYITSIKRKRSLCGTKAVKSKDRVTALVCASATDVTVPMSINRTARNPKCFVFLSRQFLIFISILRGWIQ